MTDLRSKRRILSFLAASLFLGTALAGCVTEDAQAGSGELYVKDALTDDVAEVHVTFTRAEVLPSQAQEWVTVYEGEQSIELLGLSAPDAKAKLAEFEIEPGEYLRLRITITNVTAIDHNGTERSLAAFGNVVTIAHGLTVEPSGNFEALVDFDLERGVDIDKGEYVPVVGYVETTYKDEAGAPADVQRDDRPEQSHAVDQRGLFGLCTAWSNSEQGRMNGTAENSTAFQWLNSQASADNQTVEAYCAEQSRPGAPSTLADVLPEDMPEQAREHLKDIRLGPPEDRPDRDSSGDRTAADDRTPDEADQRSGDAADGNQTTQDRSGDDASGNQTSGDDQPRDPPEDGDGSAGGNQTGADDEDQGGQP